MLFVLILSHRAASYGAIMAALPYMQLYIADYLADTMHLSAEEHGAYLLLMFNYWQTGKPIPKNRLAKIARLTNERWADVEPSLQEFFAITARNGRIFGLRKIWHQSGKINQKISRRKSICSGQKKQKGSRCSNKTREKFNRCSNRC